MKIVWAESTVHGAIWTACVEQEHLKWLDTHTQHTHTHTHTLSPQNATCPSANSTDSDSENCAWFRDSCWGCVGRGCQWTGSDCVHSSLNGNTQHGLYT